MNSLLPQTRTQTPRMIPTTRFGTSRPISSLQSHLVRLLVTAVATKSQGFVERPYANDCPYSNVLDKAMGRKVDDVDDYRRIQCVFLTGF